MLRREVPEAREILRNLIVGRIVFTPRPETRLYEFSGRGSLGRLLAGTASSVSVVTPAGFIRNTSASASFDVVGEALAA